MTDDTLNSAVFFHTVEHHLILQTHCGSLRNANHTVRRDGNHHGGGQSGTEHAIRVGEGARAGHRTSALLHDSVHLRHFSVMIVGGAVFELQLQSRHCIADKLSFGTFQTSARHPQVELLDELQQLGLVERELGVNIAVIADLAEVAATAGQVTDIKAVAGDDPR